MTTLYLRLHLQSDTTFGRGDGVAGWIDAEVEYDEYGLPFLRGRALKGLLVEECAHLLFSLRRQEIDTSENSVWWQAAQKLWGRGGSGLQDDGGVIVGDACLPDELRQACRVACEKGELTPQEILASLTAMRRQTALAANGAPLPESLRNMRVVLRENVFEAPLWLEFTPDSVASGLLAACVKSLRRVGTGRNRGRGKVSTRLSDEAWDGTQAEVFTQTALLKFQATVPTQPTEAKV